MTGPRQLRHCNSGDFQWMVVIIDDQVRSAPVEVEFCERESEAVERAKVVLAEDGDDGNCTVYVARLVRQG